MSGGNTKSACPWQGSSTWWHHLQFLCQDFMSLNEYSETALFSFFHTRKTPWVHLVRLITDSSSKKKSAHCTVLIQMKWKMSSKEKDSPDLVPSNFVCYVYPLLILNREKEKGHLGSAQTTGKIREKNNQNPTSYLWKWKIFPAPKIESINPPKWLTIKRL